MKRVPPFSITYDVVLPFLGGSLITGLFTFLIFGCIGWIDLKARTVEHPDGWYHVDAMCHKTRVGGLPWHETCVPIHRRPR